MTKISYDRLQEIFDTMFNQGYVCDKESMVQFIIDRDELPGLSREEVERAVAQFIEDTYNG